MALVMRRAPVARALATIWAGRETFQELDPEKCTIVLLLGPRLVIVGEEEERGL